MADWVEQATEQGLLQQGQSRGWRRQQRGEELEMVEEQVAEAEAGGGPATHACGSRAGTATGARGEGAGRSSSARERVRRGGGVEDAGEGRRVRPKIGRASCRERVYVLV